MTLHPTAIPGAFVVRLERREDERGFFARTWAREAFEAQGLAGSFDEVSVSWNPRRGTLRGMHYQVAPFEEAKLVTCPRGAVHDVLVDLRGGAGRPTVVARRLDAENLEGLYVPPGVAHGFVTLEDATLVHYQIRGRYSAAHARGVRWDDPALGIAWPVAPAVIGERDRAFPLLDGGLP